MQSMKLIDTGKTAQVYEYESGKVCKLFYSGYPEEYAKLEFSNAAALYKTNIQVPQPFEMLMIDNRIGIVYERIYGTTLHQQLNEHEDRRDALLDIFAAQHKHLLSHRAENIILSYKEFLSAMIAGSTTDDRHEMTSLIASLPDGDCVLHGDFHPNNILITEDNTPVIIDFMNVCYGPKSFDIARTYFLINQYDVPLANDYLCKMGVTEEEIKEYIQVIEKCRKYEANA